MSEKTRCLYCGGIQGRKEENGTEECPVCHRTWGTGPAPLCPPCSCSDENDSEQRWVAAFRERPNA